MHGTVTHVPLKLLPTGQMLPASQSANVHTRSFAIHTSIHSP